MSVIARDGKLTIEAAKKEEPDEWCKFTVWQVSNANDIGKTFFALQAPEAANKLFCSVIGREGGLMPLEAEKAGIDEWSCFELTHL